MVAITFVFGCASSTPAPEPVPSTETPVNQQNNLGNSGGNSSGGFDFCTTLQKQDMDTSVLSLAKELCSTGLATLREPGNIYKGESDAKILKSSAKELSGDQSQIKFYSASASPATVENYFAMLRLQMRDPDKFKSAGFEVDAAVKYEIKENDAKEVSYVYENSAEDDRVKYAASTKFITLKEGEAYATATVLNDDTVKPLVLLKLAGLVVLLKNKDGGTEVLTVSDQTYDNSGDHAATTSRATKRLGEEQKRSYKNSKSADKAAD
jgi:hypothetical protein